MGQPVAGFDQLANPGRRELDQQLALVEHDEHLLADFQALSASSSVDRDPFDV